MLKPDYPCKVINTATGYGRENRWWILGRLLCDQEGQLTGQVISVKAFRAVDREENTALEAGRSVWGRLQLVGLVTIIVQLGVGAIPFGLYFDWGVFLITVSYRPGADHWRLTSMDC